MVGDSASSTHPPLPPTTEDERLSWLRLLRSRRVGSSTFFRLMGDHGSAAAALDALPEVARAAGVQNYEVCPVPVVLAELKLAKAVRAQLLAYGAPGYPKALMTINDPPPLLWARGNIALSDQPCLSVVGARNASSLGARMAKSLAQELGKAGHVIVSGLARGIDTAAHSAALPTGTIAVLASGVDVIYPAENAALGLSIAKDGLILSESPMGLQPQARHFPRRNRIVSGLSPATIVVEAAAKSGSLITARTALDQGREVMAVPGHPFDGRATGCNVLIRDGATLVRSAEDVLSALPAAQADLPLERPDPLQTLSRAVALHEEILARLSPAPLAEDELIRDLGQDPRDVTPALTDLEMQGRVWRQPGGLLAVKV